jgi:thioredoxin-like negative regulator of GroEL
LGTEKDITPIINRLQTIHDNIVADNEEYDEYKYSRKTIDWNLALAYIKNENIEKAKELLKPLAENGDDNAIKLLEAINKLKKKVHVSNKFKLHEHN